MLCLGSGSNRRPFALQANALPTELPRLLSTYLNVPVFNDSFNVIPPFQFFEFLFNSPRFLKRRILLRKNKDWIPHSFCRRSVPCSMMHESFREIYRTPYVVSPWLCWKNINKWHVRQEAESRRLSLRVGSPTFDLMSKRRGYLLGMFYCESCWLKFWSVSLAFPIVFQISALRLMSVWICGWK